jgi:hypothetical protein
MAGYVNKFVGRVYEGTYKAGEELTNGIFANIANGVVVAITGTKTQKLAVEAKTTLWGKKAFILRVVDEGTDETYFVENEFDFNSSAADYNLADYSVAAGKYVRMKRLLEGEQIIMSVADAIYAGAQLEDVLWPVSGGSLVRAPLAPVLTTNLSATKSVATGAALSLAVVAAAATDTGTLTYAWYKDGEAVAGATTATYSVAASADADDAGTYVCKVTNTLNTLTRVTTSVACVVTVTAG